MFTIFNSDAKGEAKVFMGSQEETREHLAERKSPYDQTVVSTAPICTAEDTLRALKIAEKQPR